MAKTKRFTDPWSPSKLAAWEQCPRQFKFKYIEKLKEVMGPAADRGTMLHGKAEEFIRGAGPLHGELKQVKPLLVQLRKAYKKKQVMLELALGFDHKWRRTKDWFTKDTWLRVKMDVAWLVDVESTLVIDWKTGKHKPEDPAYNDQLSIYAVASLASGWGVRTKAQLIFTDHGKVEERDAGILDVKQLPMAKEMWEERVAPIYKDKDFAARPGVYCKWCTWSHRKGGKCEF